MKATTPPLRCASARTCWQSVVLPDDSGPKISVIRPRGMPPTPSARSSAMEPVGMASTCCRSGEPSFMIEPRPNCFSMDEDGGVDRLAPLGRYVRSARSALPVIAICPSRSSSDPSDRSPERTSAPPVDQPSCASSSDRPFLARLDHLDVLRRRPSSGDELRLGRLRLRLLLASRRADLASHRCRLRVVWQPTESILHADFTAASPVVGVTSGPARKRRSSVIEAGEGPGRDRGSDPGHEV